MCFRHSFHLALLVTLLMSWFWSTTRWNKKVRTKSCLSPSVSLPVYSNHMHAGLCTHTHTHTHTHSWYVDTFILRKGEKISRLCLHMHTLFQISYFLPLDAVISRKGGRKSLVTLYTCTHTLHKIWHAKNNDVWKSESHFEEFAGLYWSLLQKLHLFLFCAVPKGILQSGFSDPNIQTVLQSPASLPEQETR